jgi:hypothetical protein
MESLQSDWEQQLEATQGALEGRIGELVQQRDAIDNSLAEAAALLRQLRAAECAAVRTGDTCPPPRQLR